MSNKRSSSKRRNRRRGKRGQFIKEIDAQDVIGEEVVKEAPLETPENVTDVTEEEVDTSPTEGTKIPSMGESLATLIGDREVEVFPADMEKTDPTVPTVAEDEPIFTDESIREAVEAMSEVFKPTLDNDETPCKKEDKCCKAKVSWWNRVLKFFFLA